MRRLQWRIPRSVLWALALLGAPAAPAEAVPAADAPADEVVQQALRDVHRAMDAPEAAQAAQAVERAVERWEPALERHAEDPEAREALHHLRVDLGRAYVGAGRRDDARRVFGTVAEEADGTPWGDRAEGWLYELDHLNVGQASPGFEVTTLGGDTLSSEDLRGRVVVLSFWGTY